ncbi:nitrite reductase small subunit NirD [Marinobacterium sedimentorum]|uniref:nitrite reductase small subunit NirD n=1 Tax=Marinobacterium sedimentorum TaxID=2927804 RepID=UPI0020C5D5BA|nr:nitrite reductase small subunit NirD [Marinobacterium sedimentorum]MCP8689923.1 nitrite reductase small subunit NirD [Marinobacterium sedimentorum]
MTTNTKLISLCSKADLVPNSGVCALVDGRQVALFYLPEDEQVYAIDNHDPFGQANVLSRGIVGSIADVPVVASPLYKQRFSLVDGQCFEDEAVKLATWQVTLLDDVLMIDPTPR